jgi:hypothetical protein
MIAAPAAVPAIGIDLEVFAELLPSERAERVFLMRHSPRLVSHGKHVYPGWPRPSGFEDVAP